MLDRNVGEVANDGVNILAHITHLGELCGLHFDERRIGQAGQATRDLGFANAGGADHENVFWRDLDTQPGLNLLAPPAVAQGNGNRPFGLLLAHDMPIEFGHNFLRGHGRVSMLWFMLV